MVPVLSLYTTTLAWVDYNLFTKTLRVKFRKGARVTEFQRVPAPVYRALIEASSPDEFFRTEIEHLFPAKQSTLLNPSRSRDDVRPGGALANSMAL